MNPNLGHEPGAIRVNLTLPTTTVRIGPIQFDGLKALLGMNLADVLGPMMVGPREQRQAGGSVVDVYPLAIPEGEGLSFPVKMLGEVGFQNLRGALLLVLPAALIDVVRAQLQDELANGTALGPRLAVGPSGATVSGFLLAMRPGMRKAVPLGSFGELGIEAA